MIGRTDGCINTKLHADAVAEGCRVRYFTMAGEVCDHTRAAALQVNLSA
jgi:hypothetical protein